jgi:hypothetical protein
VVKLFYVKKTKKNYFRSLFRCSRIRINPHVLRWIGVKFELNYTPIHPNSCGLRWIRLHPNKASIVKLSFTKRVSHIVCMSTLESRINELELLANNTIDWMSLELGIGKVAEYRVVFVTLAYALHWLRGGHPRFCVVFELATYPFALPRTKKKGSPVSGSTSPSATTQRSPHRLLLFFLKATASEIHADPFSSFLGSAPIVPSYPIWQCRKLRWQWM